MRWDYLRVPEILVRRSSLIFSSRTWTQERTHATVVPLLSSSTIKALCHYWTLITVRICLANPQQTSGVVRSLFPLKTWKLKNILGVCWLGCSAFLFVFYSLSNRFLTLCFLSYFILFCFILLCKVFYFLLIYVGLIFHTNISYFEVWQNECSFLSFHVSFFSFYPLWTAFCVVCDSFHYPPRILLGYTWYRPKTQQCFSFSRHKQTHQGGGSILAVAVLKLRSSLE